MKKISIQLIAAGIIISLLFAGVSATQQGVIYVESEPSGAGIYVNDLSTGGTELNVTELIGVTPLQFFLNSGNYTVYLKKFGYSTWWQNVTVTGSSNIDLGNITLTEDGVMFGAMHIATEPAGADVTVIRQNGAATYSQVHGTTPISLESLAPGTYSVLIERSGYYTVNQNTTVVAGEVTELDIPLVPYPDTETVYFNTQPAGASLYISESAGQSTLVADESTFRGKTPVTIEFTNGSYCYQLTHDGYLDAEGNFTVLVGTPISDIEVDMTPVTQYIDIYFESEPSEVGVMLNGSYLGTTPDWITLPCPEVVDISFEKPPYWAPKTLTVDTSMFTGRPSKWGETIQLDRMNYTVTTCAGPHITIVPSTQEYVSGSDASFTISALQPQYEIAEITIDGISIGTIPEYTTEKTWTITDLTSNHTIAANARTKSYYVNAITGPGGCCNYPGANAVIYGNNSPVFMFTPESDYVIQEIEMDSIPQPIVPTGYQFVNVVQNHTIECTFHPTHLTITPVAGVGGSICPNVSEQVPWGGCTSDYVVTPDEGYEGHISWSVTNQMSSASEPPIHTHLCNVTDNWTVTASFEKKKYTLTSSSVGDGTISPSGTTTVEWGSDQTFTMTPDTGNELSGLTDNGVSVIDQVVNNSYTIQNICADHEVVATFGTESLIINATTGTGGTIDPLGEVSVVYNDSQCFTITADENYTISDVIIDGTSSGPQINPYNYEFSCVTENHTIEAVFAQVAYVITPTTGTGGSIAPSTPQTVPSGSSASFTVTADSCYTIGDVIIDGVSSGPQISPYTYQFNCVTSDHTIEAQFNQKTHTITATAGTGGSISPAGTVQVLCGNDQVFNMTPDTGNMLLDVKIDGVSVGAVNPYTFSSVTTDHTIEAVFVLPPGSEFSADRTKVPPNYAVQFYDLTTNNPSSWFWEFGDGEISMQREPLHYYTETGNYSVKLTTFNSAAPSGVPITKQNYIEVTEMPIASFTADREGGYAQPGVTVNFVDTSLGDPLIYSWDYGDNSATEFAPNATHTYTEPGVYLVTLQVTKPGIGTDYAHDTITVLQKPTADFTAHPVSGMAPLTVHFEDTSEGFPTQWLWNFGDENGSYERNPVHTYHSAGSYNVTLKVSSYEGEDQKTVETFITVG